jgi:DNA-directed RNA polymerase subunit RPC12/RpoP
MREVTEVYKCPSCKTKMDIILKLEAKGRCVYCNYIAYWNKRVGTSGSIKPRGYW